MSNCARQGPAFTGGKYVFRNLIRRIPLFGPLTDCDGGDHWAATQEIFIVSVVSTIPLWLGAVLMVILADQTQPTNFGSALTLSVANGELFILCTSLLGPILWIALKDPPGERAFPSKLSHMLLVFVISILAAATFGAQKSGHKPNSQIALGISLGMFAISIVLRYLAVVYHNSISIDPPSRFQQGVSDYVSRFEGRKK
jgi:hypothetical protein